MTVLDPLAAFPPDCRHGVVTIGHFDGAHLGHAALLRASRRLADRIGGNAPVVAVTFEPHARAVLRPDLPAPAPLTILADRLEALRAIGADRAVAIAPTRELLDLPAGEFFNRVLVAGLAARGVVEGPDFCFGKNRTGSWWRRNPSSWMAKPFPAPAFARVLRRAMSFWPRAFWGARTDCVEPSEGVTNAVGK
jgi:riboflavin kinase/FMN adenylyltransferase